MTEKTISPQVVRHIAALARIHLEDNQLDRLTGELRTILDYIKTMEKLDVSRVQPTSHVLAVENVFRPDQIVPSLPQDQVLRMAVAKDNGSFKVPQVIE